MGDVMQLEGRVALVTGGAVRLGRALALALAAEGARLVIHYHSSARPAKDTVAQIVSSGADAQAVQGDLSQFSQVSLLVKRAVDCFGRLDILVNSAAIFERADLSGTTEAIWDRHFGINLKAPFFLSQAFAAHVGPQQRGQVDGSRLGDGGREGLAHIVNIADWRGLRPDTNHLAYSLTKSGVIAMTKALALALAPTIRVNAIAPGAILPPPGQDQAYLAGLAQNIPLGRVGSPGEIAQALLYLLHSDFVTGETLFVTGGEHLT
jgi:pteridine reductase